PGSLNSHDEVVGGYADADQRLHGYLWRDGVFTTFDAPNAGTFLGGINNRGDMVGLSLASTLSGLLVKGSVFTTFDARPDAFETEANGINNRGDVVGLVFDRQFNEHGFIIEAGVLTLIDVPGAPRTGIGSIDAAGRIVGDYTDSEGHLHGFVGSRVR